MSASKYSRGQFIVQGLPPTIKIGIKVVQVKLRITRAEVISLLFKEYNEKHKNDHVNFKKGDAARIDKTAKEALALFAKDTVRHRQDFRAKKRIL